MNSFKRFKLWIAGGASILLFLGFFAGFYLGSHNTVVAQMVQEQQETLEKPKITSLAGLKQVISERNADVDFELYWQVWDAIKEFHIEKENISDTELFYGSLEGLLAAVDDPYSTFFDPQKAKQFAEDISGSFSGVGIHIGIKDDVLTVISPLKDSPAAQAGLLAADKIMTIDGEDTAGISIDEAVSQIRGVKGEPVVLGIYREGFDQIKDYEVIRDTIVVNSVDYEKIDDLAVDGNYFYLKLSTFGEGTYKEFDDALTDILAQNPQGLVLDLRNNPGGLLDLSIKLASLWVEDGVIVTEKMSDGRVNRNWAMGNAILADLPTVILINEGSASASEILAGALQDHEKAIIVGAQSFGKGSVQSLFEFDDKSAAKITIAHWLTPDDRQIEGEGIAPDAVIDRTFDDYQNDRDPQLDYAKELLGLSAQQIKEKIAELTENTEEN